MEQLTYKIEDKIIAELLGVQNFTNKESAILELVKNAFDAQSQKLIIKFTGNQLILEDDGIGINADTIKNKWMFVGRSDKGYKIIDTSGNERVLAGSKGIGRFALARLGKEIELYSKSKINEGIFWETNWDYSNLHLKEIERMGTTIVIKNLRDNWTEKEVKKLIQYLSRTCRSDKNMEIIIYHNENRFNVEEYFSKPKLGFNCLAKINLEYSAKKRELSCIVESDEFKESAKEYYTENSLKKYVKNKNLIEELLSNKQLNEIGRDELNLFLGEIGNFKAELYFSLRTSFDDEERFLYKHPKLAEPYESGVILYRNSFSISSYEGTKDWIGLGKRARKSPATATHPTGAWRVRENNISGFIELDKEENKILEELSNRQGLNENIYYEIFLLILDKGIAIFEKYRQNIIRSINTKNSTINKNIQGEEILDSIIENPKIFSDMTDEERKKVVTELKGQKIFIKVLENQKKEIEEIYKYDSRILNTLSTSGLRASSFSHELINIKSNIESNIDYIIKALKSFGMWEKLDSPENKKKKIKNVPALLNENKIINKKILTFINIILSNIKKNQFVVKELNFFKFMLDKKIEWEENFGWIKIELIIPEDIIHITSEDVLKVIFDNLILNSIQQNEELKLISSLNIKIEVESINSNLEVTYSDSGKGLDSTYNDDPFQILEVHETTRSDGHGLGMWMVNNTIKLSNGSIKNIEPGPGFKMKFSIGEGV